MAKKYLKKHRYSYGVQQEIEDLDYLDKLPPKEREWMEQFMYENYGNGGYNIPEEERILKKEEHRKDATRNNNMTNRDALNRIKKYKPLSVNVDDILHKLSSESNDDWREVYKKLGFHETVFYLCNEAAEEMGLTSSMKFARIMCRFYVRMKKLRLMLKKEGGLTPKRCVECKVSRPKVHFADDMRTIDNKAKVCLVCKGEL